jgi:hypothetical protein
VKNRFFVLCASALALCGVNAVAQEASVGAASAQESTQKVEIGSGGDNNAGTLKTGNIVQNQSGKNSRQSISIGNAKGSVGKIVVGNIVQSQSGATDEAGGKEAANNKQTITIGSRGGDKEDADLTVGNIVQNQKGVSAGHQQVDIGKGSTHQPQVGDIIQSGGGTQKVEVGKKP